MEKRYKEIDGVRYQVIQNTILGSNVIPVGESLPEVTTSDNGKLLGVSSGEWTPVDAPSGLPDITGNAGKVLKVNAGATGTEWANETTELPAVTAADEGDVLTVNASGEWEAAVPGGGGGGTLYVQLTPDNQNYTFTADKTFNEVAAAVKNGYYVTGYIQGTPKNIIPLQLFNVSEYEEGVYDGYLKFENLEFGGEDVGGQAYLYLAESGFEWTMDNSEPVEGKTYTYDKSYFNFVSV